MRVKRGVWLRGRELKQSIVLELLGIKFPSLVRRGIDAIWHEKFGEEDIDAIEKTGKGEVDRVYDAMTQGGPGTDD